jgi:hypothetical protein
MLAAPAIAQLGRVAQVANLPSPGNAPESSSEQLHGTVLILNLTQVVLMNEDRRILEIDLLPAVKFTVNTEGGAPIGATASTVSPGDQVTIDATRDPYARYHAEKIQLDMKGGADEKKAAAETLEIAMGKALTSAPFFDTSSSDPFIDKARVAAVEMTQSLPNFLVHQTTTRYYNGVPGPKIKGRKLDVVSLDLITENDRVRFQNMLINGKKPTVPPEATGSWSIGEYSSTVTVILQSRSKAKFKAEGQATIASRTSLKYFFVVDEAHSRWLLINHSQRYMPAYSGNIWFDEETARVLRVEVNTDSTPLGFPIERVSSAVEYAFFRLGSQQFLLPAHAEVVNCDRGKAISCSRNEIEFSGYRKFSADSTIRFEKDPRF